MGRFDALVDRYREDGYVVTGPLLGATEVERLRAALDDLERRAAAAAGLDPAWWHAMIYQLRDLWLEHPAFAAQVHHPLVEEAARTLLGVDRLQLFYDYTSSKPPGSSLHNPWHQDRPYFPIDRNRMVSCWLALDDVEPDSGAMLFLPGSHREGEAPPVDQSLPPADIGARAAQARTAPVAAGSYVLFDGLVWHMSPPNRTARERRAYITIYLDPDTRFDPDHTAPHVIAKRINVGKGERLNEDGFPLVRRARE